jgi:hypothetical protein
MHELLANARLLEDSLAPSAGIQAFRRHDPIAVLRAEAEARSPPRCTKELVHGSRGFEIEVLARCADGRDAWTGVEEDASTRSSRSTERT